MSYDPLTHQRRNQTIRTTLQTLMLSLDRMEDEGLEEDDKNMVDRLAIRELEETFSIKIDNEGKGYLLKMRKERFGDFT